MKYVWKKHERPFSFDGIKCDLRRGEMHVFRHPFQDRNKFCGRAECNLYGQFMNVNFGEYSTQDEVINACEKWAEGTGFL